MYALWIDQRNDMNSITDVKSCISTTLMNQIESNMNFAKMKGIKLDNIYKKLLILNNFLKKIQSFQMN